VTDSMNSSAISSKICNRGFSTRSTLNAQIVADLLRLLLRALTAHLDRSVRQVPVFSAFPITDCYQPQSQILALWLAQKLPLQ
jgi:hypothetical protein